MRWGVRQDARTLENSLPKLKMRFIGWKSLTWTTSFFLGKREMRATLREARPWLFARKRVLRATGISTWSLASKICRNGLWNHYSQAPYLKVAAWLPPTPHPQRRCCLGQQSLPNRDQESGGSRQRSRSMHVPMTLQKWVEASTLARDAVPLPPGLSVKMEKLGAAVTLLEPNKTRMLVRNGMLNWSKVKALQLKVMP